jgi:Ser/Thr protein kinase RdoA (MazF antagonist)
MRTDVGTAKYWWERAEEARAFATHMHEPDAKRAMETVIQGYETRARLAEAEATSAGNLP